MKRKITRVNPDGSKEIVEEMDEAPAMQKNKMQDQPNAAQNAQSTLMGKFKGQSAPQGVAAQGQRGDTELAHVNPWEQALLKKLGGAGTTNPLTGLKQFYSSFDPSWYQSAFGREGDPGGLDFWSNYQGADPWAAFLAGGQQSKEAYTGWTPTTATAAPVTPTTATAAPVTPTTATAAPVTPPQTTANTINIPLDIFPYSASQSTSGGSTSSSNTASNYSGLPGQYQNQLLAALMPQLTSAITNMPGNIDQYTNQALSSYQQQMRDSLRTDIPTGIRNIANRGIISSTEGNKVLSDIYSNAATAASDKGYTTAMQAALLKAQMPSILAQIGQLGQTSYGSSAGTSAGSTYGQSTSYQEDPTVMYRELAATVRAMMG